MYISLFCLALTSCKEKSTTETASTAPTDSTNIVKTENSVLMGGKPIATFSKLPEVGSMAPNFTLADMEMKDQNLDAYKGKFVVLNIFPSVDTGVCSASVRKCSKTSECGCTVYFERFTFCTEKILRRRRI